jgi:DNA-binding CsgD family transcriptional regulator
MALTAATTPLLEREHDLEALDGIVRRLQANGHVAIVRGPAGIGKTSLVNALSASLPADTPVLCATGGELEAGHAFGIVRQLFHRPVLGADRPRRDALLTGAAAFAAPALGLPGPTGDSAGILHGLYWLLAGIVGDSPLVIVVDDAHWADETSMAFIHYLARRIEDVPLLLLVAHRVDEPGPASDLLTRLADLPLATIVEPLPLSKSGIEALARSALGGDPSPAFCDECAKATAGNPFLLHELLRAAQFDGLTGRVDEAALIGQMTPATISRAVTARLARTSEPARKLAQAVAILGTDAHPALAGQLARLSAEEAREAADELAAGGILRQGERLDFVHPLVRASVLDGIRPGARGTAHRLAAGLMADGGYPAGEIAAHLHRIEPAADAWVVTMLRRAATEARVEGALLNAAAHLERALDEPVLADDRALLLRELGGLLQFVDPPRAIVHLSAAAETAGHTNAAAEIRWALAKAKSWSGDLPGAVGEVERAAELEPDLDRRRTLAAEAFLWRRLGGMDRSPGLELLRSVIPAGDDDRGGARDVRTALALEALDGRADHLAIAKVAEVGVQHSAPPPRELPTVALFLLVWVDRADIAYRVATDWIENDRNRGWLVNVAFSLTHRAYAGIRLGMLREAEADARAGLQLGGERRRGVNRALGSLVWSLVEQGALDQAEADWQAGVASDPGWQSRPDVFLTSQLSLVRARLQLAQGNAEEAAEWALAAAAKLRERGLGHLAISRWHDVTVSSLAAVGHTDQAAAVAAEALRDAQSLGTPTAMTIALRLGAIATTDRGRQIELLSQAASHLDGVQSPVEQARTLVELGAALRRDKRRVESREPLRRALDLAVRVNAAPLAERAREELRAAGARPRRVMLSGVESLTASELRVAQLAAAGLTNPEIAQRLYVTRSTVETHLSRCFMKLSIDSRAQLAGFLDAEGEKIGEPH